MPDLRHHINPLIFLGTKACKPNQDFLFWQENIYKLEVYIKKTKSRKQREIALAYNNFFHSCLKVNIWGIKHHNAFGAMLHKVAK